MNRWVGLGLLLITAGALALRCPQLALRPMHNDEAVNALKIKGLWESRRYAYDPNEHHGPTLYYATLPFVWFSGAPDYNHLSENSLRAVSVFFGLTLVLLLWLLTDALGRTATLLAGVLIAISPAMVFYSRYFIHEMLLVAFTGLFLAGGWRYSQTRRVGWAILAGAALGLMYATKETFLLPLAAAGAALGACVLWDRWRSGPGFRWQDYWNWRHALAMLVAATAVSLVFFTSFFTHASGPLDSLRTYAPWLKRAGGESPHIHPWYFYLQRLTWFKEVRGPIWSEGLIVVLAGSAAIGAFTKADLGSASRPFARFLALYTILLTAAYSIISYKTPWCLLGFLHGMVLLAGVGAVMLFNLCRRRPLQVVLAVVLAGAAAQLGWQAWRASFRLASDRRNPYVYAQTVPDVLKLVSMVQTLAKIHPDGDDMVIKVMARDSDYWPLPWYLRAFKRVGWWDRPPSDPYAPVMITSANLHAAFDDKSDKAWLMVQLFELRPKTFLELYVQFSLWEKYVQTLPKDVDER